MRHFAALFRALFLSTVRNRQGLFWTFFSPVLFMVVFGFLGSSGTAPATVYVTGGGGRLRSLTLTLFRRSGAVKLTREHSWHAALAAIRAGNLDAAVRLPHAVGAVTAYFSQTDPIQASIVKGVVGGLVGAVSQVLAGHPPALNVVYHAIQGRNITYLDFVVPGIMALMAMNNSLFGLSASLTRWKETRVLRRLLATPIRPASFLGAALLNQLLYGLLALFIVIGMALMILNAEEVLHPLTLAVLLVLGVGTFLALGLAIGGMAKSQEAVMPMINVVAFPMMFLSGVFFPVSSLPGTLHTIVNFLPLTFLASGLRSTMNGGVVWNHALMTDALGLLAWMVLSVAVAVRTWRWE